jgi:hypothetical protein
MKIKPYMITIIASLYLLLQGSFFFFSDGYRLSTFNLIMLIIGPTIFIIIHPISEIMTLRSINESIEEVQGANNEGLTIA